jgi:hypothetical protein
VKEVFENVMKEIKADWRHNFVVYPFLPSADMAEYM